VREKLKAMAVTPGGDSSSQFRKTIDTDIAQYRLVIEKANIKVEN
jgi:hypothetical protein